MYLYYRFISIYIYTNISPPYQRTTESVMSLLKHFLCKGNCHNTIVHISILVQLIVSFVIG